MSAIGRTLQGAGLDWHDLAERTAHPSLDDAFARKGPPAPPASTSPPPSPFSEPERPSWSPAMEAEFQASRKPKKEPPPWPTWGTLSHFGRIGQLDAIKAAGCIAGRRMARRFAAFRADLWPVLPRSRREPESRQPVQRGTAAAIWERDGRTVGGGGMTGHHPRRRHRRPWGCGAARRERAGCSTSSTCRRSTRARPADPRSVAAPVRRDRADAGAPARAWVEWIGPRAGDRPAGAFSFGASKATVETALAVLGVPFRTITPATWKRAAGIPPGKGLKDLARARAIERWPGHADLFGRGSSTTTGPRPR